MNILLCAATKAELGPVLSFLQTRYDNPAPLFFRAEAFQAQVLLTGVGSVATAFSLGQYLAQRKPQLALQVGIAGSYRRDWPLGQTVVQVSSEQWGDLGAEQADGSFQDVFQLGLQDPNAFPYINGKLYSPSADFSFLPTAQGLTVQTCSGTERTIAQRLAQYPQAEVESMEGAAFFYACLQQQGLGFVQIRALSNYVEPRNRAAWQIPQAIEHLGQTVKDLFLALEG
jgi:futalosine hydrolase